jgi:hypothetical protein
MILMGRLRSSRVTKVLEKAGEMSVYESAALPTELRRLALILNVLRAKRKEDVRPFECTSTAMQPPHAKLDKRQSRAYTAAL